MNTIIIHFLICICGICMICQKDRNSTNMTCLSITILVSFFKAATGKRSIKDLVPAAAF